jgi:hypothetical protein
MSMSGRVKQLEKRISIIRAELIRMKKGGRVIRAKRFEVVSSTGRGGISIGMAKDGPRMRMFTANSNGGVWIGTWKNGSWMNLWGHGKAHVAVRVIKKQPKVCIFDKKGKMVAHIP